ncbi:hypothetical protein HK097_003226 [Rhizophlyctis rosea]|uniref:Uncharacterized protein n=1 Tax=Rhizophlyctis rosea TaxID=64517 RepID=A0AAD5X697_9FUNG|nr:hypothetical protein HK097_003226 [Rhizophlyctis rosea]
MGTVVLLLQALTALAAPQGSTPNDPCLAQALDFENGLPSACPLASVKMNDWLLSTDTFNQSIAIIESGLQEACPKFSTCLTYMQKTKDILTACQGVQTPIMFNHLPTYTNPNITIFTFAEIANETIPSIDLINETICSKDGDQWCFIAVGAIPFTMIGDKDAICKVTPTCWKKYDTFNRINGTVIRVGTQWAYTEYLDGVGEGMMQAQEEAGCVFEKKSGANHGAAVPTGGIIGGVVVAILVVCGIVAFVIMRRRKNVVWWRNKDNNTGLSIIILRSEK